MGNDWTSAAKASSGLTIPLATRASTGDPDMLHTRVVLKMICTVDIANHIHKLPHVTHPQDAIGVATDRTLRAV